MPRGADGDGKGSRFLQLFLRPYEARQYPARFRGKHLLCLHQLQLYFCSLQRKSSSVDTAHVVEGRERESRHTGMNAGPEDCLATITHPLQATSPRQGTNGTEAPPKTPSHTIIRPPEMHKALGASQAGQRQRNTDWD